MVMGLNGHSTGARWCGGFVVAVFHAAALWGLWNHRLLIPPAEATTLFVAFIASPVPPTLEEPRRKALKLPAVEPAPPHPQPRPLVAQAPATSPSDVVAPPAPAVPAPAVNAVLAPPAQTPAGPVTLATELSVSCPDRPAPAYPVLSRRKGEIGSVVLRVELDEEGQVSSARIATASGHDRLDEAAMTAVKAWRCVPAQRNGHPVRALALQAFNFVLQGN